ncbi:serine-rich adhesin for platelets-like [Onthophagus taurus]|uniref:serine-rich adhesin for platelets-like n=1 Tax=Onthophagus taurus TaxID=166361 RepID=UPI0039BE408A
MCDSTLLLIKDKIINTDAIIKLLSDKNTQINRLKRQLKFLYKKYLAQIKELEICNLKETTNQSYIDEKTLLEKYTELEGIHQDYVNVSTIKYQNICKELEECKSSKSVTTIKTIKKCNKCKEEVENNRVLKRQITNLKQNIEQLTKTLESKNGSNLNDFKYSSEYKLLKQHHTTEIENLMSEHMMELDKVETKFKSEINIYQDRIVSLEAQDMIYKDKIDELKLELNETKICLAEKNKVKPENHINNEIKGGLYELLSECDLELPKVDDQLKTRLDQSSQTDEISFYNNNTNPIENVDVASLFGDNFSDVLSDHQEDFMEFKDLDAKTDCNELLRVPLEPLEEEKEDLNDENLDVWRCIQEMKEIPEPLSSLSSSENEDETTTPKKKNVFNKRIKLKRLAQENRRKFIANIKKDVFKSLVKHVGKMLKKSTDKENKSNSTKSKKMSKQFKNKRKLEMLRWTALREISSTDSDVSCTSKSKIKMRKLERYKHLNVNNKEEYAKFCAKFNTMTDFYNSLSGNENKINDNGNIGEESCWSGQDSGFGKSDIECGKTEKCIKSENDKKINIQSIKILKQDKLQSKLASSKEIFHDDSIKNQKTKKKSTIIGENQFLHNSKEELLFGECSSSENDNVSFDTKDLVATLEVSSDSLETTSLKELSQSDSFENNNDNFEAVPKTVNEIVATKAIENDLVQKSTENDDTNSFKDSDNKKQTISRRYSVRINKLKHQPTKKWGEEIIENEKIDKKLLTNSILEIISTEESIKLCTPSQLSNKNGCSSSESDNEICNKTENNCNSTKKSTIIEEIQFPQNCKHNSKEELLFGDCSSSENDNVSVDTKELAATRKISSDSLETTSLKELSQSDLFENNNLNNNIVETKTIENDLVNEITTLETSISKSTGNDTNSFKDSDNKKQTITRRYSERINKLKHQPSKKCGEEIIENEKSDKELLTNSILELISTEESIKLSSPSQLSNKNGCSSSESDNEICNKTENTCNSTKKSTITEEIQYLQNCKHNSKEELLFGECSSSDNDNISFDTKELVTTRKVSSDSLETTSFKELSQSDLFENNNLNNNIVETKTIENDLVNEITTLETSILKSTGNATNSSKDSDNKKQTISRRYSARINKLKHQPSKKCGEEIIETEKIDKKLLTNSILELISTEESIKLSTPSQLSNKNGCSSSESDNEICNKTENTCNSTKKSTIIEEIQYLQNCKHNSKEELLFGECSSSENDNVSFDTKELVTTRKVSSDSLETTSLKELSQTDSFENNNLNNNNNLEAVSKTVKEIVETKTIENDLVNKITTLTTSISKSTENDDTNSFKDSDNKKQTITRRYSPRINKLKHQAIKRCRKEIIENKKIHNKLLTNSILELISTEESIEPSISSQLSNKNGCSTSESDTNEISHNTQNNSDELSKLELPNSQIELSSIKLPSVINGGDVPVRPMKIRKANEKVTNLKRKLDEPVTKRTTEPANKLKKLKDNFVKRFNKDDMVKEVIKVEMERKLEKACFKRPVKRPLCTPTSPPHSVDFEFTPPKIIPLKKVGQLHEGVCKKLLKKLIQFPGESVILQEIFDKFSSQKQNYIIRLIIAEVLIDTSKSDNKYTPPAPLLTPVQRTLLGLTIKLQESFPDILTEMLFSLERSILIETSLDGLISTTRFYTGICKLKKELHRMRRMIGDVFFTLNNLAIPFLYTVLSTWTEILPLEAESHDNMLVKVLIQIINMKNCKPGYCLTTLKGLLQNYYGYPKERWKSEDVFNETFTKFKENPSKFLEFALLILFKNHPNKWVYEQMRIHLKPLLNDSADNQIKKAIVVLISNTLPQFGSDNCQYVQEIKTWLNLNLNSVV